MYGEKSPLIDKAVPKTITIAQQIAAESIESQITTQKGTQYLAALIGGFKITYTYIKVFLKNVIIYLI